MSTEIIDGNIKLGAKILSIQSLLSVPKNQYNSFGNYNYRSCEDILEALKPFLAQEKILLTIKDEVVEVGGRNYVKATVEVTDGKDTYSYTGFAREEESKKGMDGSQITGASSSYARKYALNGLFLIDDTKDSDSTNTHDKAETQKPVQKAVTTPSVASQPHTPQQDRECPVCHGEMWNNIGKKLNPAAPDYKCKDKNCTGVIWPKKELPEIDINDVDYPGDATYAQHYEDIKR